MSHRIEQVNSLILREVSSLILTEADLPKGIFVTVSRVETSRDLRYAKIFITILPEGKTGTALEKLQSKIGLIQSGLNDYLSMKPIPRIRFVVDDVEKKAGDIDNLLDRIKKMD